MLRGVAEIDARLDALAAHIGRPMTEDEQSAVLDIVDDFQPKDEKGDFLGPLISFEKAWEVYELRSQIRELRDK